MAEFTFGEMLNSAENAPKPEGTTDRELDQLVQAGKYRGTVVYTNSSKTGTGKSKIGFKFRIDTPGPFEGGGVWAGQVLSPESPASLEIWFKTFETLGVPRAHWTQFGSDIEAACADVATRIKGAVADIVVEIDGQYGPKVKYVNKASGAAPAGPAAGAATPAAAGSRKPDLPF